MKWNHLKFQGLIKLLLPDTFCFIVARGKTWVEMSNGSHVVGLLGVAGTSVCRTTSFPWVIDLVTPFLFPACLAWLGVLSIILSTHAFFFKYGKKRHQAK